MLYLLFQQSNPIKGIDNHPRFPCNMILLYIAYAGITAVFTVVAVISQHKIFVFTDYNFILCHHGIFYLFRLHAFCKKLPVDVHFAVFNLHGVPGQRTFSPLSNVGDMEGPMTDTRKPKKDTIIIATAIVSRISTIQTAISFSRPIFIFFFSL